MNKRLLRRPEPFSDESMIGYLTRLSYTNGYENLNPILALLDDSNFVFTPHRARNLCMGKFNIEQLSYLTDKPQETFYNLIFQPNPPGEIQNFKVGLANISDELMNFRNPAVCIQCLKESYYHRKIWTVSTYTVCLKHLSLLQDTCSTCNAVFSWSKTDFLRCRCGSELKIENLKQVKRYETLLAQMTAQAINGNIIIGHPLITDMQSLYAIIHLGFMLCNRFPWSHTKFDISRQITSIRHIQLLNAFKPFSNWPESFHQFLAKIVAKNRTIYPTFSKSALLFRLSMALDRFLLKNLRPSLFHLIEQEFRKFIHSIYPSQILLETKSKDPIPEILLSKEETKNMLSISKTRFNELIKIYFKKSSLDEKYPLRKVNELKKLLLRLVTLKQAANILNLSEYNTINLLKKGIITTFFNTDPDSHKEILIDAKELNDLLTTIEGLVKPKLIHDEVPFLFYIRKYNLQSGRTLHELINGVLEGHLPIVRFDKEEGLMGIFFSKRELLQFIDFRIKNEIKLLNINDVIIKLNSYRDAVYRIMSVGLLKYNMEKINTKKAQRYVLEEELTRFKNKYILPNEISEIFQTNATNITERLKHLEIYPVSGPTIDNGLIYIFERKDITKISKQQLDKVKGYPTHTGRPKTGQITLKRKAKTEYMDAKAVAELLGDSTNIQNVSRLVKMGFIKAVNHNGELGNKRYFETKEVLLYLSKFRNNPLLIKLEDIPKWLSIKKRRLDIDWLKSGRLKLIDDGLGQHYAHLDDLKKIKKIRVHTFSTQELAESVGKTRHDINNAIRLGKIQPISGPNIDGFPNFFFHRNCITKLL